MSVETNVAVYALEHAPSGGVYVGSSQQYFRRRQTWFATLARFEREPEWCPGYISLRFIRVAQGSLARDWSMYQLERFGGPVSDAYLWHREKKWIQRAKREYGDLCLNAWAVRRAFKRG